MRSVEVEPNELSHPLLRAGVADSVEAWRADLENASQLTGPVAERIIEIHGDRGVRAIEAVTEGRVKEYRDFTVVVGHDEEYVVEGRGCTCKDSEYNLDPDDPTERCWHALAVVIAEATGRVDEHDMWYSEVREFL
jgi:predicted nucleic acid-binding Zn finger protein